MMNVNLVLLPDQLVPSCGAWLKVVTPTSPGAVDVDEVTSLATFCLRRATTENPALRAGAQWTVRIEPARSRGYVSYVTLSIADVTAQSRDADADPLLAVWDGFASVERMMRTPDAKRLTAVEPG